MEVVLLLILVAMPLIEIALLISLGQAIGFWWTIAFVVGTAVLGSAVLHAKGFAVLSRANAAMAAGRPPIEPVVDGVFLLMAGLLLITPGVLTDAIGLLLLIPPLRRAVAVWTLRRILSGGVFTTVVFGERTDGPPRGRGPDTEPGSGGTEGPGAGPRRPPPRPPGGGPVIEGEFERIDERTGKPEPKQGP